jgi:hypothetical protein
MLVAPSFREVLVDRAQMVTSSWQQWIYALVEAVNFGPQPAVVPVTANGQAILTGALLVILAPTANRTGVTLVAPTRDGLHLQVIAAVTGFTTALLPSTTAIFSSAGNPTMGGAAGQVKQLVLTAYDGAWVEAARMIL